MKVLGAGCCCCTALQAPRKQIHTCLWVCWQPLNRAGLKLHVQHEVVRLCYHRDVGQWRWAELVACLALCLHAAGCCFLLCFECGPASWRLHLAAVCLLTWILLTAGKPAALLCTAVSPLQSRMTCAAFQVAHTLLCHLLLLVLLLRALPATRLQTCISIHRV